MADSRERWTSWNRKRELERREEERDRELYRKERKREEGEIERVIMEESLSNSL